MVFFHCSRCGKTPESGFRLVRALASGMETPFVCGECLCPGEAATEAGEDEYLLWILRRSRFVGLVALDMARSSRLSLEAERKHPVPSIAIARLASARARYAEGQAMEVAAILEMLQWPLAARNLPAAVRECREMAERLRGLSAA